MKDSSRAGIILMVLSALCFSCSDISIKVIGGNMSPWLVVAGRGLFGSLVVLVLIRFEVRQLWIKEWPMQLLLGSSSAMGFLCLIISLKHLPLSIAMPLSYSYPAIAAILSPLINKEKVSRAEWLAIALALAGAVCFSQSSSGEESKNILLGLTFGLAGAFFVGLMATLARRQTRANVPLSVNLFFLYFCNTAVCLPLVLLLDRPLLPGAEDLAKLFMLIAPVSVLGFCLMLVAYRYISAHRGGTIMMLEAAVAALYGLVALGEPLSAMVFLGGFLMIASAISISREAGN